MAEGKTKVKKKVKTTSNVRGKSGTGKTKVKAVIKKESKTVAAKKKIVHHEGNGYIPSLFKMYNEVIVLQLIEKLGYKNKFEVPKLEKISLNIGMGRAKDEPASLEHAVEDLTTISGQKAVVTSAKKAISNFKLRVGDPVGCRVTLRKWKMYEFFERLITIALPRVRDFTGLPVKAFDKRGNYSFGIEEQIVFPEIDYDKIDKIRGLQISIVTTANTDMEAYELLSALGFPFRGKLEKQKKMNDTKEI